MRVLEWASGSPLALTNTLWVRMGAMAHCQGPNHAPVNDARHDGPQQGEGGQAHDQRAGQEGAQGPPQSDQDRGRLDNTREHGQGNHQLEPAHRCGEPRQPRRTRHLAPSPSAAAGFVTHLGKSSRSGNGPEGAEDGTLSSSSSPSWSSLAMVSLLTSLPRSRSLFSLFNAPPLEGRCPGIGTGVMSMTSELRATLPVPDISASAASAALASASATSFSFSRAATVVEGAIYGPMSADVKAGQGKGLPSTAKAVKGPPLAFGRTPSLW